ncbi:hypothetical protein [Hoylesella nanceiensis]|uniref:hypothetical protein n=1 Tax=Hoylesella nanceiensis TaxID=425941 RepID=UPI00243288C8|nr:hypothetical protein [Hoylesella nanceiensis]
MFLILLSLCYWRMANNCATALLLFCIYMLLAFSTVLMTYFGVNYFLGGMHSYA